MPSVYRIEFSQMCLPNISDILREVGLARPTVLNISCPVLSVVVTIQICSWDIPLSLEGSPLWRAFLFAVFTPFDDSRIYFSSNSQVPDKAPSSYIRDFSRRQRNLCLFSNTQGTDLFKRLAVSLIGTHRMVSLQISINSSRLIFIQEVIVCESYTNL